MTWVTCLPACPVIPMLFIKAMCDLGSETRDDQINWVFRSSVGGVTSPKLDDRALDFLHR
jgi:hypothetical protein